jgi:hypothetical protein
MTLVRHDRRALMDTELKQRIKADLKRLATYALAIAALGGALGVAIAASPALYVADQRGELTGAVALGIFRQGARLALDIGTIAAFLTVTFLRSVSPFRAAGWIAVGMIAGSIAGAILTFSAEINAWTTAYMIGGAVIGLVAACVRLWGAERASRGHPVRYGTLLVK